MRKRGPGDPPYLGEDKDNKEIPQNRPNVESRLAETLNDPSRLSAGKSNSSQNTGSDELANDREGIEKDPPKINRSNLSADFRRRLEEAEKRRDQQKGMTAEEIELQNRTNREQKNYGLRKDKDEHNMCR